MYDSKWTGDINPSVHLQLGSIYASLATQGSLPVDICHVDRQEGNNDCGLYAIAYATDLAHGRDPSRVVYSQDEMRKHLIECLESEEITPFPVDIQFPRAERPSRIIVDLL